MGVLVDHYHRNPYIIETIRKMYGNIRKHAVGHGEYFYMAMGVMQGFTLSPTLFGLYFDCVAEYICTALLYAEDPQGREE